MDNAFNTYMKGLKRAFTLIELLVVIGIIIILGSILTTGVNKVRKYANNVQCVSNLKSLYTLSAIYYQDHKVFPSKWSELDLSYESENIKCPSAKKYDLIDQFYCINGILSDETLSKSIFDIRNNDLMFVDYILNLHNNCSNGILNSGKMIQLTHNNFGQLLEMSYLDFISISGSIVGIGDVQIKVIYDDIDTMPVFYFER
ncbi:hypothetical protein BVX93_00915 [bacterium B13(2017)]|nr:hypothetical protein BVX93_00915 [bacterium B13(2017)]